LRYGRKRLYADLGAERLLGAEKGRRKIIVEVKSFVGPSDVKDLEQALGQYVLYRQLIDNVDPERYLYLAVTTGILKSVFEDDSVSFYWRSRSSGFLCSIPKARWLRDGYPIEI
jgi:hypothetical protein